jgi:hypothetical protein
MISRSESLESNVQCGHVSRRSHQPPAVFGLVFFVDPVRVPGLPKTRTSMSAATVPAPGAVLYRLPRAMRRYFPARCRFKRRPCDALLERFSGLQVVDEGGAKQRLLLAVPVAGQFAPERDELVDRGPTELGAPSSPDASSESGRCLNTDQKKLDVPCARPWRTHARAAPPWAGRPARQTSSRSCRQIGLLATRIPTGRRPSGRAGLIGGRRPAPAGPGSSSWSRWRARRSSRRHAAAGSGLPYVSTSRVTIRPPPIAQAATANSEMSRSGG